MTQQSKMLEHPFWSLAPAPGPQSNSRRAALHDAPIRNSTRDTFTPAFAPAHFAYLLSVATLSLYVIPTSWYAPLKMVSLAAPVAALPSPPASSAANPGIIANISRKRKHVDDDDDEPEPSASSQAVKKARVSFDPAIEVHVLEDYDEKGLDLIREEVRRAIDNHIAGDSTDYDQIKALFASRPSAPEAPSTKLLKKYVVALIGSVNMLGKNCSGLVHAVLDCSWLARDESFKRLYITFLGSLMSAYGGYTSQVLQMLVKYLVQRE